jgi:hypothetical protein
LRLTYRKINLETLKQRLENKEKMPYNWRWPLRTKNLWRWSIKNIINGSKHPMSTIGEKNWFFKTSRDYRKRLKVRLKIMMIMQSLNLSWLKKPVKKSRSSKILLSLRTISRPTILTTDILRETLIKTHLKIARTTLNHFTVLKMNIAESSKKKLTNQNATKVEACFSVSMNSIKNWGYLGWWEQWNRAWGWHWCPMLEHRPSQILAINSSQRPRSKESQWRHCLGHALWRRLSVPLVSHLIVSSSVDISPRPRVKERMPWSKLSDRPRPLRFMKVQIDWLEPW